MKYEKPYIAKLNEVTITREGDIAIIEYKKENVSGVNFKIGDKINKMSDQDILDLHNDGIQATLELAKDYEYVAVEIPHNKPQIKYFEEGGYWAARGDVLRSQIGCEEGNPGMATILIDDKAFTMQEFGRLLSAYEGWGMRLVIVPKDETHVMPPIEIKDPDDENAISSLAVSDLFSSKIEH